ncbi:DUF1212-domain-containing protein [Salix suchowensis]|nr:DUF1212-domain-containing protein [Salix suchowensis]
MDDEEWRENEKRERRRKRKTKEFGGKIHSKTGTRYDDVRWPSNRLQAQIQSTARVLDIPLSCMYLPDVILISFDDNITVTSNVKLIRQSSALDLGKLKAAYRLYWKAYQTITDNRIVGRRLYVRAKSRSEGMWYQQTPSIYWGKLHQTARSLYAEEIIRAIVFVLSQHEGANAMEMQRNGEHPAHTLFTSLKSTLAFAVGVVSNVYGRFFSGNAFVVMVGPSLVQIYVFLTELACLQITGILFQLPSGLGYGGLLTFASQQSSGFSSSYVSGFQTALQLISVGIGLSVGLGISLVVVHPIQSRRRAGGVFSL